jgi:hypothetical protein
MRFLLDHGLELTGRHGRAVVLDQDWCKDRMHARPAISSDMATLDPCKYIDRRRRT